MAGSPTKYDSAVGAALLTPLERALAAALHEHHEIAARRGRPTGPLAEARVVIHALARFMHRGCVPAEVDDKYAVSLASATLKGAAWARYRELERLGIGPHEALHQALHDIREVCPAEPAPLANGDRVEGNTHG